MNLNSFSIALFLFSTFTSPFQDASASDKLIQSYRKATSGGVNKEDCKVLKKLSVDSNFSLYKLARIRYYSHCQNKANWGQLDKEISEPYLRKAFVESWFQDLLRKQNYKFAYRIFKDNKKYISLDKKEFENLALPALKMKLTPEEKSELRKKLYKKSPRFKPNPKKNEYTKVARDYRDNREFEKALKYYRLVINDSSFSDVKRWYAFKGARLTYKLERWSRMDSYLKASRQWSQFLKSRFKKSTQLIKLHHNANIEYIRTLWTERGQDSALNVLDNLEKDLKGLYSLQLVYWLKGKMAEEKGDYKKAVADLNQAASEKSLGSRDKERILWSLAWNQRRIGQYKESQSSLEQLINSPDTTFWGLSKYQYWQAENLESMGKTQKARSLFQKLAENDAYGYYGALALRKLGRPFPTPPKNQLDANQSLSLIPKSKRSLFKDLVAALELDVADHLVSIHVEPQKKWDKVEWLKYLKLLQEAGAFKHFFVSYHKLKPEIQSEIAQDYPQLMFPRPFEKEVQETSLKTQVSPALIYSIMKQESGFDVKARSPADAFGLLQLIPQVAQKVAAQAPGVEYSDPRDLFDPDVIIPLGAYNLKELFRRFKSNFIMSVASYNASEKAVQGWVKTRFNGDPITFIEDIPYEETKGYVKLVMRNYIVYNRLEDSPEGEAFYFPESCLNGLENFK